MLKFLLNNNWRWFELEASLRGRDKWTSNIKAWQELCWHIFQALACIGFRLWFSSRCKKGYRKAWNIPVSPCITMDHFSCVVLQCSSCLSFSRPNVGIVCGDEGHPCLSAFYELTLPELKYNPNPGPSLHLIPTKVPSISSSGQLNYKSGVNRRQLCHWLCPLFHPSGTALVATK